MSLPNRELIVLLNQSQLSQQALAQEVEGLHTILAHLENSQVFYNAHELVNRDYITNKVKKIKKAVQFVELKPFRFLINKN